MNYKKQLEPSLLAFDLTKIDEQLTMLNKYGINYIHYDVMDDNYGKAFDIEYLQKINHFNFKINVHIMDFNPLKRINSFLKYKINSLTFQYEPILKQKLDYSVIDCLQLIKSHDVLAGIAIEPYSQFDEYKQWLDQCDIVTVMSVIPGKGGQAFMEESLVNLKKLYDYRLENNLNYIIEVDGGINLKTISKVINWADFFVSGSGFMLVDEQTKKMFIDQLKQ